MGMLIPGRAVLRASIAVPLLCAAAALLVANAAHAARRGSSHAARHGASHAATPALDAQAVNAAQFSAPSGKARARGPSPATVIKEEILLDRAGFSPGQIDGQAGTNDQKALVAFQGANGIKPSGRLDAATWDRLTATSSEPALTEYEIQPADVSFETAGTKIVVPNVARKPSEAKVEKVVVDKSALTVRALDGNGKLISFYPASVGSEERPAPNGTLPIRSVAENPTYTYRPKLKFKGVKATKPFTIAPGPNNPVGNTWIDLGDGFGIHGTPEPQNIGKTESHGCVRLTNWDAEALGKMVRKGIKVEFIN